MKKYISLGKKYISLGLLSVLFIAPTALATGVTIDLGCDGDNYEAPTTIRPGYVEQGDSEEINQSESSDWELIPGQEKLHVYRFYNPNSGEHFYTISPNESYNLELAGWTLEGFNWTSPKTGNNVYRLYNPNTGDHFYTLNENEYNHLKTVGWKQEGASFYSGGNLPVLRLYNPNERGAGSHHYTTSEKEKNHLVTVGWRYEGIAWYGEKFEK